MSTRSIIWTIVGVLVLGGVWLAYRGHDTSVGIPNTGVDTTVVQDHSVPATDPATMPDVNAKG